MELIRYSQNLLNVYKRHQAISSNQLGYYCKLVEYELIREVILDLAYEYELNLLTSYESDLYCTVARIWTECHVSKGIEETCFYSKEEHENKIMDDILSILHTRMEKKLNERLGFIELTNSRCVLQKEVKELETLLATYDNKDGEYHKLVKRYVDCQQQLSLRSTLLHDNDTIQLNRRSHKNFSSRRSLSVDVITRK
ncbi:unnamed protein product [Schistosoma mattheei]|uniref:Uncharacterized protein n=1 Tax=Schistosoma mattheei TaxID=31246 RepID=A0A183NZ47_9TREM|nr:unnamed protein product [Schistosoma mattheei]